MAELNARDAKLVQFLNEAHAKEAELEADLTAHINLTQKAPYKKRLQQHLRETKDHKKRVARQIKDLGGNATAGVHAPGIPDAAGELAGKAIAAVKGQVGVARAALTEKAETHVRNAREELREEYVEIGTYLAIEALATEVGDRQTAQLAKSIRRDEQKMADYLERLIPQLMKDVVKKEIPREQRPLSDGRTRRSTSTRKRATTSRSRTTARKSSTRSPARKATTRARRATKAAATGARSGARAASTSAKRSAAGSRGGSSNGSRTSSNGRSRTSSRSSSRKVGARS